jgi:outer membrane cobalamin receptor
VRQAKTGKSLDIELGGELEKPSTSAWPSDVASPVAERNTDSADAIYQHRQGAQVLQANFRIDDSSQFGSRTTRALAYGLTAHAGITRDDKCRYPAVELASSIIFRARE